MWSTTVISRASCSGSSQPLPRPAASQPDACVAPHRSSEVLLSVVVSARLCHVSASKYRKVSPQFQRTWVKFPPVWNASDWRACGYKQSYIRKKHRRRGCGREGWDAARHSAWRRAGGRFWDPSTPRQLSELMGFTFLQDSDSDEDVTAPEVRNFNGARPAARSSTHATEPSATPLAPAAPPTAPAAPAAPIAPAAPAPPTAQPPTLALTNEGLHLYQQGRFREAQRLFERALAHATSEQMALLHHGRVDSAIARSGLAGTHRPAAWGPKGVPSPRGCRCEAVG